ncbi:MAG: VTT domain-containing protein, partial [Gemmatimonadota bacterium]|nr:VTT domain-containing protein [Gemmatimonadota bacterium]
MFVALEAWLTGMGGWALLAAPLVMAGVAVLPIPAEAPAMLNGALFGPVTGTLITWTGALAGAWISFEIARALGRPVASRIVSAGALDRTDALVERAGWSGLLILRLLPVVAFTAINWGAGLTSVSRWRFLWTTALGIVPGAILFTASGSAVASLIERGSTPVAWAAGAAVVAFLVWAFRRSRRGTVSEAPT